MYPVFLVMAPLALIIAGSALMQYFKKLPESWESVLNSFALYVGLPTLIFSSLVGTKFSDPAEAIVPVIVLNSAIVLGVMGLMWVLTKIFRVKQPLARTMIICLSFGNVAYLGIPLLSRMTGGMYLPELSLIAAVYLFWVFTAGIWYLEHAASKGKNTFRVIGRRVITNPLLLSVFAALLVIGLHIPIPEVVMQTVKMLSAAVTPLVLVVIGLFIGRAQLGKISEWWPAFLFSLAKVAGVPVVVLGVLFVLNRIQLVTAWNMMFALSILDAAMPVAITPFALAEKYSLDKKFIAQTIVISTVLAFVGFTVWLSLVAK